MYIMIKYNLAHIFFLNVSALFLLVGVLPTPPWICVHMYIIYQKQYSLYSQYVAYLAHDFPSISYIVPYFIDYIILYYTI